MTRRKKLALWIITIFTILSAIALYLILTKQPPPLAQTTEAREALTQAKTNKADIYAEEVYKQAESMYDSAMACWKRENLKPFYKRRNYDRVIEFAGLSTQESQKASSWSIRKVSNFQVDLKGKIETGRALIKKYDIVFRKVPIPDGIRDENNRGQLLLKESELAYQNEKFVICSEKVNKAVVLLEKSYQYCNNHLEEYFAQLPTWKRQVETTIAQSRQRKSNAIVVDKFARQCYLYQSGKLKHQFNIELGPNWIGDKTFRGDKRTPEGFYKVTSVKSGGKTKFYKALLINYPNSEDQERYKKRKTRNSHIGNLIEIHGHGGKQGDWTDGCVALTNSDMDILFRYSSVGMPVTIVGSLRSLNEIFN